MTAEMVGPVNTYTGNMQLENVMWSSSRVKFNMFTCEIKVYTYKIPRRTDTRMNHQKHLTTYAKIVGIESGIMIQKLSYNETRKLVLIDQEEVVFVSTDPLGEILVSGLKMLESEAESTVIKPLGSVSALFETGTLQRSLNPRIHLANSVRDGVKVVGAIVSCSFTCDETLGTTRFDPQYCAKNDLPKFGSNWLLIDVVASRLKPSGALLTTHAILEACKARCVGVCAVAVSAAGLKLLKDLNFASHSFKDKKTTRNMCYMKLSDLSFSVVARTLKFKDDDKIVESICFRDPHTKRAMQSSMIGRC